MVSENCEELFEVETIESVTVICLNQISIVGPTSVETIGARLRELANDSSKSNFVIDFSQVRFFSSQMLGLLVDLWRRLKETGGCLVISGINPQLNRVFRITHLDRLFDFYDDKQAAISVFHSR